MGSKNEGSRMLSERHWKGMEEEKE